MQDKDPYISDGLLAYLERAYPDKSPEPEQTEREIWMHRGAVGVVRHLRRLHEDQHEKELNNNVHGQS